MIPRLIHNQIQQKLEDDNSVYIQGGRHVGTTELMRTIQEERRKDGYETAFFDIETARLSTAFSSVDQFLNHLQTKYPYSPAERPLYLFLDEIQYLPEPIVFLNELHNKLEGKGVRTIASASTRYKLLVNESTSLEELNADVFTLYPLSWREYLTATNQFSHRDQLFSLDDEDGISDFFLQYQQILHKQFTSFLQWGGYPEVFLKSTESEKQQMLRTIVHDIINTEVVRYIRDKDMSTMLSFLRTMSRNIASPFNHNEMSNRLEVHKHTLKKLIMISSGTFLFSFIKPYFTNPRREMSKMVRIFADDLGVANYFAGLTHMLDLPLIHEPSHIKNFVFSELRKHLDVNYVFFYRTIAKAEIDFVVKSGDDLIPIQVAYGENKQSISVATKNFIEKYKERVPFTLVLTRKILKFEKDVLFLPVTMLPFVRLSRKHIEKAKKLQSII